MAGLYPIITIKQRKHFLETAKRGSYVATKGLVLQAILKDSCPSESERPVYEIGFTCTKKIGNAVIRNHCKRRLRALAYQMFPDFAKTDFRYVLIARHATVTRSFHDLKKDLIYSLHQLDLVLPKN